MISLVPPLAVPFLGITGTNVTVAMLKECDPRMRKLFSEKATTSWATYSLRNFKPCVFTSQFNHSDEDHLLINSVTLAGVALILSGVTPERPSFVDPPVYHDHQSAYHAPLESVSMSAWLLYAMNRVRCVPHLTLILTQK